MSDSSIKLGSRQYMLMYHFVENPGTSAYDISQIKVNGKKVNEYSDTKDRIRRLRKLKFLEEDTRMPNIQKAHYLKLSERGIYHMITGKESLPHNILKSLLRNYRDQLLFRCFLYPYIGWNTLLKIGDSAIFSHIFSYLHDCCKMTEETTYVIGHTYNQKNGKLVRYIFSWDSVSKDEDKKRLCLFLKQGLRINWADNAEIRKSEDDNSISVYSGSNSLLIKLNRDKTRAVLSIKGIKKHEFLVKGSYVWTDEIPPTSVDDIHMGIFHRSFQLRVQQLIFSMLSNYGPDFGSASASVRILSHDTKFMQILKETKNQFERKYSFFVERQKL